MASPPTIGAKKWPPAKKFVSPPTIKLPPCLPPTIPASLSLPRHLFWANCHSCPLSQVFHVLKGYYSKIPIQEVEPWTSRSDFIRGISCVPLKKSQYLVYLWKSSNGLQRHCSNFFVPSMPLPSVWPVTPSNCRCEKSKIP